MTHLMKDCPNAPPCPDCSDFAAMTTAERSAWLKRTQSALSRTLTSKSGEMRFTETVPSLTHEEFNAAFADTKRPSLSDFTPSPIGPAPGPPAPMRPFGQQPSPAQQVTDDRRTAFIKKTFYRNRREPEEE